MEDSKYQEIMKRLDFVEFRQELLFYNDDVSRSVFEYGLNREQYNAIMKLMQSYSERINQGEKCNHGEFEADMYGIVPKHKGDYHMCEEFVKGFKDEHRWEDVFDALYGHLPKFAYVRRDEY